MSYLEAGYKTGSSETLYKLPPPTCEKYEPNFLKIFSFVQDGNISEERNIFSPEGDIVARLWENERIFEFKKWLKGIRSNRAYLPLLVKNPDISPEQKELIGVRNGLVCPP